MSAVETLRLNAGESLAIADNGEGLKTVTLVNSAGPGYIVGIGRSRKAALESAQGNLQQALNIVDLAIVRGDRS